MMTQHHRPTRCIIFHAKPPFTSCTGIRMFVAFAVTTMAIVNVCTLVVVHSFVIPHHDESCSTNRIKSRITIRSGSKDQHQRRPLQAAAVTSKNAMIEYTGEGLWDTEFIREQISLVPNVQIVSEMPEPLPTKPLANIHFYLLRHGQSTANVAEIISSDRLALAYTEKHGLTELGNQQATASAQQLLQLIQQQQLKQQQQQVVKEPRNHHKLIFVSSPFARARQTALACLHGCRQTLQLQDHPKNDDDDDRMRPPPLEIVPSIRMENLLVERYFGIYDNDSLDTYGNVWPLDQDNVTQTSGEVESVAAVATRIQAVVLPYLLHDDDDQNIATTTTHVVLVSHGDVLQIAQLYAANVTNVGEFSSYRFQSKSPMPLGVIFSCTTCFGRLTTHTLLFFCSRW